MTRARGGFTLIELLVSAVLLASISAGVATVMSVCLGAWKAGQARADLAQRSEVVLDTVGRDLRASFIGGRGFLVSRDDGDGRYYLELTTLSRRSQRLLYLAERGEAPGENISDMTQVIYFMQPAADGATFALYRQELCPPERQPLDEEGVDLDKAQLLCDNIVSFRLRFWDSQQAADWVSDWDSGALAPAVTEPGSGENAARSGLPAAAEVVLTLRDGERERVSLARIPVSMGVGASGTTTTQGAAQ